MKGYFEKMKKFVLAFGIPVLAVASLIGSGYATWYFNNTVDPVNKDIAVEPTEKVVVGARFTRDVNKDIKLILDQPNDTTDGMPQDRQGVHFDGTFNESLVADDGYDNTSNDKFVVGTKYEITTTITIPSEVAKYVNFTFDGKTSSTTNLILTRSTEFTVAATAEGEIPAKFEDFFKLSDVTAEYTESKPKNSVEYDAMVDAMKDTASGKYNKSIKINFEARFVNLVK